MSGQAQASLRLIAPAKVNLFLEITGRRDNGYHELDSLFVFTNNGDELLIEEADSLSLGYEGPGAGNLPTPENNIVWQAATLLQSYAKAPLGAHMTLIKKLPIAAGIGGGSSNAAAALLGLNKLWALGLSKAELQKVGLALGADVPACLEGRPVIARGIGEQLAPVTIPTCGILLVNPGEDLATPDVFEAYRQSTASFDMKVPFPHHVDGYGDLLALLSQRYNALQLPAEKVLPVIGNVLACLQELDGAGLVRMSGSGATCFALFPDLAAAKEAEKTVHEQHPDWWHLASLVEGVGV